MVWNIDGLMSKYSDSDFITFCMLFDIIALVETWNRSTTDYENIFPGYNLFCCPGKRRATRGRFSVGISIYVKNDILDGYYSY